ncbi:VCBS domain-containing protein, partial [Bradyrhizobium sp.]|uniref:VCBS domain-containing protein n=1 Tax=Bradyrhizobium sp. TaxID=376 RepID=UPI003C71773E
MSLAGKFDGVLPVEAPPIHGAAHVSVATVSAHAPPGAIIVPDAHLLFTGDFKRSGVDLILSRENHELVLHDYFKGEKRAALASPDGAHLTADIVNALTSHPQYAQADGIASVAKVIGHVTKLNGSATAVRNGVSIILNQGDNVNKGDVVQSGSDSTLGITFIDGTVFGLASNAKMVLNEMIYDPNGSNNSSLLSLVQGTITFVAGATAKRGDMKVDTPVATMGIRGTAVLVEIDFEVPGQGGAPPAKFQVLVEPDGTTGSYILFDKTTLTPIATVNQAGTQTIVNSQGNVNFLTSVQLSADAQKIINEVFSLKFADANTKTNTHFTDIGVLQTLEPIKIASGELVTPTVQLINTSTTIAPITQNPPPELSHIHIDQPPSVVTFNGVLAERLGLTHSPTIDTVSGKINFADINADDLPTVSANFDSFSYTDAQNKNITATLTAEQLAAVKAVAVPLVVVQDPGNTNNGSATWSYNIADNAFDFLAAGETLTLVYLARVDNNFAPNNEATFAPITITIIGTNDTPTLEAVTAGTLTDTSVNDSFGNLTGTLVGTDPDSGETASLTYAALDAKSHPVTSAVTGLYGSLTVNADGTYSYVADAAAINALHAGSYADIFTVQTTDVHGASGTATFTVNVTGANDTATISGEAAGSVVEDTSTTAGGTLTVHDVDSGEAVFQAVAAAALTGTYGNFTFDSATGAWTYALVHGQADSLKAGQVVHDTLTVTSADGTASQLIDVTITGSNDTATITGQSTGSVVEDTSTSTGGTLTVHDVDSGEAVFQAVAAAALSGTYGNFTFDSATGAWSYALVHGQADSLKAGQVVHDTLTVVSADGTASQL